MWVVYLLRCSDNSLYCGITTDIIRRVATHNEGRGARYTRARRPVHPVYTEPAEGRSEALKREYAIKQLSKKKKEHMVDVAQLDRALDCGSRGCEFETRHSPF
jgi:putative endonuclease